MKKLYLKIYLAFIGILFCAGIVAALMQHLAVANDPELRELMAQQHEIVRQRKHLGGLVFFLGLLAVGCYPVARRITRRVEAWGEGNLATRVEVEGRDEVAELARSFNGAAARIESLVEQQRRVLANASHELRSPLARLRMAIELVATDANGELIEGATRDIAELDGLIEEVLLASRLEALEGADERVELDLAELVREQAEAAGAQAHCESVTANGDAALLRRLLRNLLDNATRYSDDVSVELSKGEQGLRLAVLDRGPGVAEADRERIFERFYRPKGRAEGEGGGVGLGLALVKQIAETHGGSVRCLARDGGGSVFEVWLPG